MKITDTPDYKSFRSSVPQRKVTVDDGVCWTYYDAGPKNINNPIVFLPPVSGTADVYFRQLLSLSACGARAISINHPVVWDVDGWCKSFNLFLNALQVDRVHMFGASLGGFLAQKFAEYSGNGRRVRSMVLCNAFCDTDVFEQRSASSTFWAMPALMLKSLVMGNLDMNIGDGKMAAAVEFMSDKLDSLSRKELASRLTLNCVSCYVKPQDVQLTGTDIMLMNVYDGHALSGSVMDDMQKMYPNAKKALLKTGGNFPYLSRSDEVNIYTQVHLGQYTDSIYSAMEPRQYPPDKESSEQPSTSGSQLDFDGVSLDDDFLSNPMNPASKDGATDNGHSNSGGDNSVKIDEFARLDGSGLLGSTSVRVSFNKESGAEIAVE